MKLSVDSLRNCDGVDWCLPAFSTYVRRGASLSRRLDSQACCGGPGTWPQAAPRERGRQDGRPPPLGSRVDMPHEVQPAPCPWCLHPPRRPQLRAERLMEHHAAPATLQITDGRVCFGCRERRAMERTLPGRTHARYGPAPRRPVDDRCRLPSGGRPLGHPEVAGQPFEVSGGGSLALVLRLRPGDAAACMAERRRPPHGQETRGDARCGPDGAGVLSARALGRAWGEDTGPLHRTPTTGNRCIAGCRMLASTATIRSSRRQAGQGCNLHIASSTAA